jgi:leader peptidase (prepilin peptidase)/N-methyltransferase
MTNETLQLQWLSQAAVLPWIALLLGVCVGSFLNVVIYRLPKMLEHQWQAHLATSDETSTTSRPPFNLVHPRSTCPGCGHLIRAHENIPIISWLVLRARCSACGMAISARYPLVEFATGLCTAYAAWHFGFSLAALGAAVFCWLSIALALIDYDTQLLPDDLTLTLMWCGLLINLGAGLVPLHAAVIGAAAGYLSLWSIFWVFKWITGKEGMGYGDFKLLAAIGAWLGWQALPMVLLLASAAGSIIGGVLILFKGHRREQPIAFGPFLAVAGVIALFWGDAIQRLFIFGVLV